MEEVQKTAAEASGSGTPVVRRDDFIRRLDGMVYGMNPREGFFEGETFLHPDMRFRFDFPSGWKTVNQKSAVQGISQNQDAMIAITLAQGSPTQAMNQFASQQGVQMGNARQTTINGLPAATAEFAAATEQGTLRGLIAFVSHGNATFQLMGYTPESRWGSYGSTISRSLGSFDELNDSRALSVQPKRIDVVQLPSAMSFSTFMQRFPSVEKPEIVALINQVEGDARLSSGALYKRVVDGR
jgi:predicted Zn-dependent protease